MRSEMYVICRNSPVKGIINFYVENDTESYFLFQQRFRHSAYDYYKNGIPIKKAFDHKKIGRDKAIQNVIRRLPDNISYIEKEYHICILEKTKQKQAV